MASSKWDPEIDLTCLVETEGQLEVVAAVVDANSVTGKMLTVAIGALRFTELSKIRSSSSDEAYSVSSQFSR